jgi:hypothetical protein
VTPEAALPIVSHLQRRGAIYYWRRKTPNRLVSCFDRQHLVMSLRTPNHVHARSLAIHLDALIEDLTVMPEAALLTRVQLDRMLNDVVTRHLEKLARVAAAAKTDRRFDRDQAIRDDKRMGWVYRFLQAQGPHAKVGDKERRQLEAKGFKEDDATAIATHLAFLQKNQLVPTKPHILRPLLEAQGVEPTAMNLAQAQEIYFHGMSGALFQADRRYLGTTAEDRDFFGALALASVESRVSALHAKGDPEPAPAAAPQAPAPEPQPATRDATPANQIEGRISDIGAALARLRKEDKNWREDTFDQNIATYTKSLKG